MTAEVSIVLKKKFRELILCILEGEAWETPAYLEEVRL